jgi:diaminopimelate epimerase
VRLNFTKMHGLGNDFMVLDLVSQAFEIDADHSAQRIRDWADRRTGIGFDQLLILEPPSEPHADFRYRIYNADGTEVEQCGNGARCVAKLIHDHELSPKTQLILQTRGGDIATEVLGPDTVEVDMGVPSTASDRVPYRADQATGSADGRYQLEASGGRFEVTPVSVGNPHGVLFVDNVSEVDVQAIGAALVAHPFFPQGANIGFCQVVDSGFARLRVFERGVGETRACGTGACAAMIAGHLQGKLADRAKISLPGGKVRISWQGQGSPVRMTGPATLVYEGHLEV